MRVRHYLIHAGLTTLWLAQDASLRLSSPKLQLTSQKVFGTIPWQERLELLLTDSVLYLVTIILIYSLLGALNYWLASSWVSLLSKHFKNQAGKLHFLIGVFAVCFWATLSHSLNCIYYPNSVLTEFWLGTIGLPLSLAYYLAWLSSFMLLAFAWPRLSATLIQTNRKTALLTLTGISAYAAALVYLPVPVQTAAYPQHPHIIMIGVDSLRNDLVGSDKTPNINRILSESVRFDHAYTPLARTFPSWMSILTSQYPPSTNTRYNLIPPTDISLPKTLGQTLGDAGYYRMYSADESRFSNILPQYGFDQILAPEMGIRDFLFATLHDFSFTNVFFNNTLGEYIFPFIHLNRAAAHLYNPKRYSHAVASMLETASEMNKPLFSITHFCAGHWPYIPPGEAKRHGIDVDSNNVRQQRYELAIQIADQQVGDLRLTLERLGIWQNAIIVLLSDHGEGFDGAFFQGHGANLFNDAENHIVLGILDNTHNIPAMKKHEVIRTIDIAPTLLSMVSLQTPVEMHGHSLWSQKELNFSPPSNLTAYMETGLALERLGLQIKDMSSLLEKGMALYEIAPDQRVQVKKTYHQKIINSKQYALIRWPFKLIIDENLPEKFGVRHLIDLRSDPTGQHNLIALQPTLASSMTSELIQTIAPKMLSKN